MLPHFKQDGCGPVDIDDKSQFLAKLRAMVKEECGEDADENIPLTIDDVIALDLRALAELLEDPTKFQNM